MAIRSYAISIKNEKETPEAECPLTFLKESEGGEIRGRFEKVIRDAQVCSVMPSKLIGLPNPYQASLKRLIKFFFLIFFDTLRSMVKS